MKKDKKNQIPPDVKDLNEFYRRMDNEKRAELLRVYFDEALYFKEKSDLLIEHVTAIVCAGAEEKNAE